MDLTSSHKVSVAPLPADHPTGGHSLECSCGLRWGTSLSAHLANLEAHDHLAWHAGTGKYAYRRSGK